MGNLSDCYYPTCPCKEGECLKVDWSTYNKIEKRIKENKPIVEDIKLNIEYFVTAYDESGYGDNRPRTFKDGNEAVKYAKSLEKRFGAIVTKKVEMQPIHIKIWPK